MGVTETKTKFSNLSCVDDTSDKEKPELMSTKSLHRPTLSPIPNLREPRRASGSALLGKGGTKNRSRSVMIKLQVPRHSPTIGRKGFPTFDEQKSLPEFRERALTFSGSPSLLRRSRYHQCLEEEESSQSRPNGSPVLLKDDSTDSGDRDLTDINKMPHGYMYSNRRNSFLYLSDTEDAVSKPVSRNSSISSGLFGGEEMYITPFAQILSTLYHVRSQFIMLSKPPISDEKIRTSHHILCEAELSDEEYKSLSLTTLNELDWCLHKLESVNSGKSMGNMAQDKFKRIMSRELSHLSERSRSGQFVAEWVNNFTASEDYGEEIDKALDNLSVIQSSQGLDTSRHRSTSVTETIQRFGISGSNVNYDELQKFMDKNLDDWEFDAFQLHFLSGSQPLVSLSYTIFSHRGLFIEFKMSKSKFINYISAVEKNYWSRNPYHNSIHAADVLHATNYLLRADSLEGVFSSLEIMAALIAAAIHDVDHPGRNNQFLINTSHELAIMYNDESVLENHHLAVAFKLLKDPACNFLTNLEPAQMKAFRRMVIDNVLATDMSKHVKHLGDVKTMVETKKVVYDGILHLDKYTERSELLQCLIHCADLSNPAKPPDIASSWAYRIVEESFQQGDEEKKLNIDIGPLGDRENVCVEKCQVSFIDFIVFPLWETWAELVYPDAQHILENLVQTREYWNERVMTTPPPPILEEKEMKLIDTDRKISDSGISEDRQSVESTLHVVPLTSRQSIEKKDSLTLEDIMSPPPASERRNSFRAMKNDHF